MYCLIKQIKATVHWFLTYTFAVNTKGMHTFKRWTLMVALVLTHVCFEAKGYVILPDKAFTVVGSFIKLKNNVFYCDSAPSEWRHTDKTLDFCTINELHWSITKTFLRFHFFAPYNRIHIFQIKLDSFIMQDITLQRSLVQCMWAFDRLQWTSELHK